MDGIEFRKNVDSWDDLRRQYDRPGVKSLYRSICSPSLSLYGPDDVKEQEALEEFLKEALDKEISLGLFKTLKEEGTCSVTVNPVTRNSLLLGNGDKKVEFRQSVYYKKFCVCEKCCYFSREQCSGGYCFKFYIPAHITDGCTFGDEKDEEGENNE